MTEAEISDRRLRRGARSRLAITRRAVDIASVDGLDGVSFGRLADDLGISKAGIQTLFRTKEQLQLATVETARAVFVEEVVDPARDVPAGLPRLRALLENWISYVERPVFPGGCFWTATLAEFDSRPGPVRDALVRQRGYWRELLAHDLENAVVAGELTEVDPELAAFQLDSMLNAANIALRLGDSNGVRLFRRAADELLRR
ncbi:TetR/AcrR family transcriptional regulator [Nocardia sp. CDC159]|uniref:TetR/AcrR family transcriptional regulator n=1 Tax=Nocardia pulmonis TaxID=2951408 RepID=A0A9X2EDE6_9NOCA|nr:MULTISPECIES: TetR/AcrR family transcriptional regulator [Nocardia]MCM6777108.1 TetR/AcrR family transcriptional regulator [Nocardia pulmonis]MCM6789993.1 TetR/AcrR family transcriptional regulator [Nocardia sp. CDC159]